MPFYRPKANQQLIWRMPSKPFVVSVEGNIGSGKSTFLNYFKSTSPDIVTCSVN